MVSDFLGLIHQKTIEVIRSNVKIEYCLSYPDPYVAQQLLLKIMQKLNDQVTLIPRSKAISLYCLRTFDTLIHLKQRYLVCDIGSDTTSAVEMTIHQSKFWYDIQSVTAPVSFSTVDASFKSYVEKLPWQPSPQIVNTLVDIFTREFKATFTGTQEFDISGTLSKKGIKVDSCKIDAKTLSSFFSPVITSLLHTYTPALERVFLTGAYGAHPLLMTAIHQKNHFVIPPDSPISHGTLYAYQEMNADLPVLVKPVPVYSVEPAIPTHTDVYVGLDFGTTFSGCAYAINKNNKMSEIKEMKDWPRGTQDIQNKVPSALTYKLDKPNDWGYRAKSKHLTNTETLVEYFKLLLLTTPREYSVYEEDMVLRTNHLELKEIVADYLEFLDEHIKARIKKENFSLMDRFTSTLRYSYCIGLPSLCTQESREMIREAAIMAKLITKEDKLWFIREPMAAALCSEHTRFILVDAGGGTVDICGFDLDKINGVPYWKEICDPISGKCGSLFIDTKFKVLLQKYFKENGISVKSEDFKNIVDQFITVQKVQFKLDGRTEFPIKFKLPPTIKVTRRTPGIENGYLIFTHQRLEQEVFAPVVDKVIGMMTKILNEVSASYPILLFGGFGRSSYLLQRISKAFPQHSVSCPRKDDSAVYMGACSFLVNPRLVTERVANQNYSIEVADIYSDRDHQIVSTYKGKAFMSKHINALILGQGQPVVRGMKHKVQVSVEYPKKAVFVIYGSKGPYSRYFTDEHHPLFHTTLTTSHVIKKTPKSIVVPKQGELILYDVILQLTETDLVISIHCISGTWLPITHTLIGQGGWDTRLVK
ncbi:hypothetical protein BDB01DRAFT_799303 [Pilobolus umbonatus]|nr:hypothetical protein BDB01DRAFT_799303 [Pilobolus umbonatus]